MQKTLAENSVTSNAPKPWRKVMRNARQVIKKITIRIIKFFLISVVGFTVLAVFALYFSFTQTVLTQEIMRYLTSKSGFEMELEHLDIDWLGSKATLRQVSIRDLQKKQMIFAQHIVVDFSYRTIFANNKIVLDRVEVDQASVNLAIDAGSEQLNIVAFTDTLGQLLSSPKAKKTKTVSQKFIIKKIILKNNYFGYDDNRTEALIDHRLFDYNHFSIDNINLKASRFLNVADTTQLQIERLTGKELGNEFPVHRLQTFFRVFDRGMEFRNLYCSVGKSILRDEVIFRFERLSHMGDFNTMVDFSGRFKETIIHNEDLARFDEYFRGWHDATKVWGKVAGKVNDFKGDKVRLRFGKNSFIAGKFAFSGLPNLDSTQMNLDFDNSNLLASDISRYVNSPSTDTILQKFGNMQYQGSFVGTMNDFVATGKVRTDLGTIITDARFQLRANEALSAYQGKVATQELDLGKLLNRPGLLQSVNLKGTINGVGFSTKSAVFSLNAAIEKIGVNGYDYRNIEINGELGKKRFKGYFLSLDPNFNLEMKGEINFAYKDSTIKRLPQGKFDLESTIKNVDFQAIGLSPYPARIQGNLLMDIYGLSLDSLVGTVELRKAYFQYKDKTMAPEKEFLFSSFEKKDRTGAYHRAVDFNSEFLKAHFEGDFLFSQLAANIPELRHEYQMSLRNNPEEIKDYYEEKKKKPSPKFNLAYSFTFKNINPVLNFLDVNASVSPDVNFEGYLVQDSASMIATIHSTNDIPQISYLDNQLFDTGLDLSSRRKIDSASVDVEFYIKSNKQNFGGFTTDSLLITTRWQRDSINFSVNVAQTPQLEDSIRNFLKLAGGIKITSKRTDIAFKDSYMDIFNHRWTVLNSHLITIRDSSVVVDHLLIKRGEKRATILLDGKMGYNDQDTLRLDVNNIRIGAFAHLFGVNASGLVRSSFKVHHAYQKPQVVGEAYIYNMMLDSVLIGDLMINKLNWNDSLKKAAIDFDVYRRSMQPMLSVYGTYDPFAPLDRRFDVLAKLQGMNLQILSPFAKPYLSNLDGSANGRLKLLGSLDKPVLEGSVDVVNGTFKINYLGSKFYFSDRIFFKRNEIGVKRLTLYDNWDSYQAESKQRVLKVGGGIYHDYFSNFLMAIEGTFSNLKVINKPAVPNEVFYGEAYASGNLRVTGYIDNMVELKVNATSDKGTKIYMPLDGYTEVSKKSYIEFVNFSDTLQKKLSSVVKKVDLTGFKMDFNLDLNDNAQFEIIFDAQAGDLIRATGNGKINLEMDEEGDFSIFGDYIISKGTYNFTLLNLINKGFNINAGSRVVFNGDLYDSNINISAGYQRQVSLMPLINLDQVTDPQNPEYRRRYPVNVLLNLRGKLMSPEIKLDIDLSEAQKTPNVVLQDAIRDLRSIIRLDEQQLNRQVFSVLVLQRLAPRVTGFTGLGAATGSSLTELLSNQLSNWVSQVDKNLELTLDLDPSALDAAQLNVSYSLLDGRLRISRAGGFTNTQNQTDVASVVGEWTIEYMLSDDGRFRAKMYNKNNQSPLGNINLSNASNTTAGFSMLYTESFSSLRDLLRFGKKKKPGKKPGKEKKKHTKKAKKIKNNSPLMPPKKTDDSSK
ncbi:translocation/assembly module TamB domain-containing protein [uncultured Microscilla sp.]|uniref:translocation/assembly module TamB domain-containing protein n=1 Tax=uncultured Microscilla sp. TaxID=432653 RepID=UPI00261926D8|nr:translocation/assembly module TamB domain-containing protein [uncultured Microscilla sp.]